MNAKSFEELDVWRKAHQVVLDVYTGSRQFPREELFGLTSQMRRSAASTPANIAEGFRRATKADKLRFYNIALASADETQYHLLLAHDLEYADTQALRERSKEVARMLNAYIAAIERSRRATRNIGLLLAGSLSLLFPLLASRF